MNTDIRDFFFFFFGEASAGNIFDKNDYGVHWAFQEGNMKGKISHLMI